MSGPDDEMPPDGAGADAPTRSLLARGATAIVAVLLIVVGGLGVWWFVTVDELRDTAGPFRAGCRPGAGIDAFTDRAAHMIPPAPGLEDVSAALTRQVTQRRWRFEFDQDDRGSQVPVALIGRDGGVMEIHQLPNGLVDVVSRDLSVAQRSGDSLWVSTCVDASQAMRLPSWRTQDVSCVTRETASGEEHVTFRVRANSCEPGGADSLVFDVTVRDGAVASITQAVLQAGGPPGGSGRTTITFLPPRPVDEPPIWRRVPKWFVQHVAGGEE